MKAMMRFAAAVALGLAIGAAGRARADIVLDNGSPYTYPYQSGYVSDAGTATSNSYTTYATGPNAVSAGTTSAASSAALSVTSSPASLGIDSSATSTTATTDASYASSESGTEGYAIFHVTATGTYNTTGTASIALANTGSASYDVEGYVILSDYSTGNVELNRFAVGKAELPLDP